MSGWLAQVSGAAVGSYDEHSEGPADRPPGRGPEAPVQVGEAVRIWAQLEGRESWQDVPWFGWKCKGEDVWALSDTVRSTNLVLTHFWHRATETLRIP